MKQSPSPGAASPEERSPDIGRPPGLQPDARRWFQGRRRVLLVGATVVLLCLCDFLVFETRPLEASGSPGDSGVSAGDPVESAEIVDGAWGRLEITSVYLESPDALIDHAPMPDQRPVWRFPGWTAEAVVQLLQKAGLTETAIAELQRPGARIVSSDGVELLPSGAQLLQITPPARQVIYEALARSEANPFHHSPLTIFGDLDRWLEGSGLSGDQQSLLRRMLWRRGTAAAFSDVSALIAFATSAAEMREAVRVMTRVATWRVRVRPLESASVATFLRYWTAEGRNLDPLPLLRALPERNGFGAIDAALLLPALGRERLYTFPSLADAVAGRLPDCNWTSLNFFVDRPQPYYLESRPAYLALTQNYDVVDRPSLLGDVVCFLSGERQVVHSCVYVAGDLVFTKNGVKLWAPWVLMRLPDVAVLYGGKGANSVRTFRLKPRPTRT